MYRFAKFSTVFSLHSSFSWSTYNSETETTLTFDSNATTIEFQSNLTPNEFV